MIKVKKYFTEQDRKKIIDDIGDALQGKDDKLPLLQHLVRYKNKHTFRSEFYASNYIKESLKSFFYDKCAFCETHAESSKKNETLDTIWQVEHFRPKGNVSKAENHSGYYWLAYEPTNLLPACYRCNAKFKKDRFPIKKNTLRLKAEDFIQNDKIDFSKISIYKLHESCLLLNPVIDNPTNFLAFNKDGKVLAKDENEKGIESIKVYGLNKDDLVSARKTIIDDIRNAIQSKSYDLFSNLRNKKGFLIEEKDFKKIVKGCLKKQLLDKINNPKSSYIAFRLAILKNFPSFVIENEDKTTDKEFILPYKDDLLKAYYSIVKKPK